MTTLSYTQEYGNQHVFSSCNIFMHLYGLDSPCNATNNTYLVFLLSDVSSGWFRTCLRLWRQANFSISNLKVIFQGNKDFQGRNIYCRFWETGSFLHYLLFWRWRQKLPSTCWYLYTNLHGVMTQKTVTFKMTVLRISNAYPLLSLYPVSIHTVQYSNCEWTCLTHAYCFPLN